MDPHTTPRLLENSTNVDFLGWFHGADAIVREEADFLELVSFLVFKTPRSELNSAQGRHMITALFEGFFASDFTSLVLTRFPEEAVRCVVTCAHPSLLLQIGKENKGADVLPWHDYVALRFPHHRHQTDLSSLLPDALTACSLFFYLLTESLQRNSGLESITLKQSHSLLQIKHRKQERLRHGRDKSQSKALLGSQKVAEQARASSGLGETTLLWMKSAAATVPEDVGNLVGITHQREGMESGMQKLQRAIQNKYNPSASGAKTLKLTAIEKICKEGIDFTVLPKGLVNQILALMSKEVDFGTVDLGKCSVGFLSVVIRRMPKAKLLEIPKENRAAAKVDWNLLYRLRFAGDEHSDDHEGSLRNVLSPCERFYARLLQF